MKQIPNLFTLLNLVFGCIAIIFILQNGIMVIATPDGEQLLNIPEKIWMASLFIGLAAVVDFLDGFVARFFNATSEMGKQLDSLADLVSFGVAPGLIMYQFLRLSFAKEPDGLDTFFIWLLPCLIIPCAAAWRLARFNLDKEQSFSFKGLPVPAVGIFVASLPLIYWSAGIPVLPTVIELDSLQAKASALLLNKWFLYGLILVLSYLMVSTMPLMALKFKDFSLSSNMPKLFLLIISIGLLIIFHWLAIPLIILFYILLSLLFKTKTA